MLRVYEAIDQRFMDKFISNTMSDWNTQISRRLRNSDDWTFVQPDCSKAVYPVKFVIVTEPRIKLATIQILH
jgi:hypothetical protein